MISYHNEMSEVSQIWQEPYQRHFSTPQFTISDIYSVHMSKKFLVSHLAHEEEVDHKSDRSQDTLWYWEKHNSYIHTSE